MQYRQKHHSIPYIGGIFLAFLFVFSMSIAPSVAFAGTCVSNVGYEGECFCSNNGVTNNDSACLTSSACTTISTRVSDSCAPVAGDYGIPANATQGTVTFQTNFCTGAPMYISDTCAVPSFQVLVDIDKAQYAPGDTITAWGDVTNDSNDTAQATLSAQIVGVSGQQIIMDRPLSPSLIGGGSNWSETTAFTAPGPGNYIMRFVFNGAVYQDIPFTVVGGGTVTVSSNIAGASWTITGPATLNGSGTNASYPSKPTGTYTINWGAVPNYTAPLQSSLTLTNGGTIPFSGSYIPINYTINASAGSNGSISPSGAVAVSSGNSQSFTITPNANYNISSVTVDNVNQGAINNYTFSNVTANHTISATFVSGASGNFTLPAPVCSIPAGSSGCGTAPISWTSSGLSTVVLTDCGGGFYTSTGSGPQSSTVYIPYNAGCYQIHNGSAGGPILDQTNGSSSCAANSTWNGSICLANLYTYSFNGNGATTDASPTSVNRAAGTSITPPTNPSRTNYTFTGWSPSIPATMPVNGGSSAAQWTPVSINGACGSANGVTYPNGSTSYSPYAQCASGTSSNTAFPPAGNSVNWICSSSNGGSPSPACSASQASAAAASGNITSNSCTINVGANSCGMNVVWGSSGTVGSVTVQRAYNPFGTIASGPSGNQVFFFAPPGTYHLDLYDNATKIGSGGDFTASCDPSGAGSTWDAASGTCKANSVAINGVCAATHYSCTTGTSADNVSGATTWTWDCFGQNGGSNVLGCSETKPLAPVINYFYSNGTNGTTINAGQSANLTWSASNAGSCTGTGFSTGGATSNNVGVSTGPLSTTSTYQLNCGTASQQVTVTVTQPQITSFTADPTRVKSGGSSTIKWSTTGGATGCAVTKNGSPWKSGPSGNYVENNITSQTTYTLSCNSVASQSLTVNIVPVVKEF